MRCPVYFTAIKDKSQVRKGQKVLIIGGSGGIGHFSVQIARQLGAQVTAVSARSSPIGSKNSEHTMRSTTPKRASPEVVIVTM